jgi:SAM-dependent methyltransferase
MNKVDEQDGTKEARRRYDRIAERLRGGHRHPTLGFHPDRGDADWWQAGEFRFAKMVKSFGIAPAHRVIDYGCGTLRLGGHFMRYLDRGNYFGMDVAADLIAMGRELVGEEIVADRNPHLAIIGEPALADAEAFRTNFLFSEAVDYHVVPDELDFYYAALRRLVDAPSARLLLSVRMASTDHEYVQGCWARPLQHFVDVLSPLAYIDAHYVQHGASGGKHAGVTSATLEFRRD